MAGDFANPLGGSITLVEQAKEALKKKDYPAAAKFLEQRVNEEFDDEEALHLFGLALMHLGATGMAYQVNQRVVQLNPGNAGAFHNLGKCLHDRQRDAEADECFRRANKIKPNFPNALEGLAMSALNRSAWEECIQFANRALAEDLDLVDARTNRGMAYLALRRWREGWQDYDANNGEEKNRKILEYGCNPPKWDGTKGLDIVVQGEQAFGDEISFASCVPDLIRDSKSVTIECDKKLATLFRRSFPTATVHGTRYKDEEGRKWAKEAKFDARVLIGELPRFYRNKDSDFHGEPYLIPNPTVSAQWRAMLDFVNPEKKPNIGIIWTGGLPKTGQKRRSVTLDTLAPLFKSYDANWVSLQYKDFEEIPDAEAKYGIKIHDWEWGNRYWDYDHVVALISQLDLVICVCTTVVHAAGAIGKEAWCLVPESPLWRYLKEGEWFPWAKSVTLYRQKGREWPINLLLGRLKDKFGPRPRTA